MAEHPKRKTLNYRIKSSIGIYLRHEALESAKVRDDIELSPTPFRKLARPSDLNHFQPWCRRNSRRWSIMTLNYNGMSQDDGPIPKKRHHETPPVWSSDQSGRKNSPTCKYAMTLINEFIYRHASSPRRIRPASKRASTKT